MATQSNKPLFLAWVLLAVGLALGVGCSETPENEPAEVEEPAPMELADLGLLVVDEPGLGDDIAREWSARRDGRVRVTEATAEEMASRGWKLPEDVDVVIFPQRMLGEWIVADQIEELSSEVWDDPDLNRAEILRHPRTTNVRFGNQDWAVPLGNPYWTAMYRRDVLEALGVEVPQTWADWDQLVSRLSELETLQNPEGETLPTAVSVPLAEYWRGQMFLARVAPYIRTRGRVSVIFDRDTAISQMNNAAFTRAADEWRSACGKTYSELASKGPGDCFRDMLEGRAAVAIGWPSAGFESDADAAAVDADQIVIARLPGSAEVYDPDADTWRPPTTGGLNRVELLGSAGLLAAVSRNGNEILSARELVKWLPSKAISNSVLYRSPDSGPFRASHLGNLGRWAGSLISPEAADQYGKLIDEVNGESLVLLFPRIPGQERYLSALDDVLAGVLGEGLSAEAAVARAQEAFEAISDEQGRDGLKKWLKYSREY